jgi:hypothetical protein
MHGVHIIVIERRHGAPQPMTTDQIILLAFFAPVYAGSLAWLSCRIALGLEG